MRGSGIPVAPVRRHAQDVESQGERAGASDRRVGLIRRDHHRSRMHRSARDAVAVVAVATFAAAVNAHYGPRGFMPLDHSVVFDGGWRTLEGQVPFRDYTTPNALTPSFIQAGFFLVFGVSWKAYVLHATVFNGLFAVLVYALLRLCGGGRLTAALYGCLSGVVFYPPLGVPFHDQHAFFFMLLAITLGVGAREAGGRVELILWTIVPFAVSAAALSKQTPTLLGVPIVLALAFVSKAPLRRVLPCLIAGATACVVLIVGAGLAAGVEWQLAWEYFVQLPFDTGQARGSRADGTAASLFALAALFPLLVVVPSLVVGRFGRVPLRFGHGVALPLGLSAAFMAMCAAFISLTLNEPTEGLPLFFASVGLFQIAVGRALPDWPLGERLTLPTVVGAVIAIVALVAGWTYNNQVNERRSASNIIYDEALVEHGLPSELSSMHFQVPGRYAGMHAADLGRVVEYLRSNPGNFVHFGDTTVLNGITDTPSVFPALFVSEGLTIPARGSHELERFERRLFDRMKLEGVRRVVVERRTWEGVRLSSLPRFQAWLGRCGDTTHVFGFFEVVEIRDGGTCS